MNCECVSNATKTFIAEKENLYTGGGGGGGIEVDTS